MSSSLGILEIKGYCASVFTIDNLLKNSTASIFLEENQNGNFILLIKGNLAEVKHALSIALENVNKISSVVNFSVIEKINEKIESLIWKKSEKDYQTPVIKIQQRKQKIKNQSEIVENKKSVLKELSILDNKQKEKKKDNPVFRSEKKELSTIERLKLEALGKNLFDIKEKKEKKPKISESFVVKSLSDLDGLNVHKLRRVARDFENFPIKGRQISKANRDELVEYFKQILPV